MEQKMRLPEGLFGGGRARKRVVPPSTTVSLTIDTQQTKIYGNKISVLRASLQCRELKKLSSF